MRHAAKSPVSTKLNDPHSTPPDLFSAMVPSPSDRPTLAYPARDATSARAAKRAEPKAGTRRWAVLDCIRRGGIVGRTREEVVQLRGMKGNTVQPRCLELVLGGLVMELQDERSGSRVLVAMDWAPWCEAGNHGGPGGRVTCYRCALRMEQADKAHNRAVDR